MTKAALKAFIRGLAYSFRGSPIINTAGRVTTCMALEKIPERFTSSSAGRQRETLALSMGFGNL